MLIGVVAWALDVFLVKPGQPSTFDVVAGGFLAGMTIRYWKKMEDEKGKAN